jgi:hypothetical protein
VHAVFAFEPPFDEIHAGAMREIPMDAKDGLAGFIQCAALAVEYRLP